MKRTTRTLFLILSLVVFGGFVSSTPTSAQTSLEDVFKKTIDDLLGKGKPQNQDRNAKRVPESAPEITLSFSPLVKKATPSVVNVYAAKKVPAASLTV